MNQALAARLCAGSALASVACAFYSIAELQHGPKWEIPAQSATTSLLTSILAGVLVVAAVAIFGMGSCLRAQSMLVKTSFWVIVVVALCAISAIIWLDPGQWPITHAHFSHLFRTMEFPVPIFCLVLWLVIATRARSVVGPDVSTQPSA